MLRNLIRLQYMQCTVLLKPFYLLNFLQLYFDTYFTKHLMMLLLKEVFYCLFTGYDMCRELRAGWDRYLFIGAVRCWIVRDTQFFCFKLNVHILPFLDLFARRCIHIVNNATLFTCFTAQLLSLHKHLLRSYFMLNRFDMASLVKLFYINHFATFFVYQSLDWIFS